MRLAPRAWLLPLALVACGSDDGGTTVLTFNTPQGGSAGSGSGAPTAGAGAAGSPAGQGGAAGKGDAGQGAAAGAAAAGAGQGGAGQAGKGGNSQAGAGQAGSGQAGKGGSGEAGAGGAGSGGKGGSPAAGAGGAPVDKGPARYPAKARHSPLTPSVVGKLKKKLAATSGRSDVFAKVGDSITVNTNFLSCFAGGDVKLGASQELAPAVDFFNKTKAAGGATSFNRATLAAAVGWSAFKTVEGSPTPIEQEITAIKPAFAVVMLGTNDTYEQGVYNFDKNLLKAVDQLLSLDVIPLVSTIPPRGQADANALVPEMNAIIRAIAQQRQIPYLDLWQLLDKLPDKGLIGDGVHLGVYSTHACWLTSEALGDGMNLRNQITLEALDRARRFVVGDEAPEEAPAALAGEGSWEAPYEIEALPFVDDGDTSKQGVKVVGQYGCSGANEGGPEVVYRLKLASATKLSVRVFDGDGVDVDIHGLTAPKGDACVERNDKRIVVTAGPGDFYLSVDTFIENGATLAGPYRITVVPVP